MNRILPCRLGAASSVAILLAPGAALAQAVFAPLTPPPSDTAATTFFATNGVTGDSILAAAAPDLDPERGNPLRWGPLSPHPRLDYQFITASGIQQGTGTVSTVQHLISPGLNVQIGRHWNFDAGLYLGYYTEDALSDTFGYSLGLRGGVPRDEWVFGASASLSSTETSLIETGQQTKQNDYLLGLSAVYGGARRLSYEFGLEQDLAPTDGFNDTYTWSTMNWVNYVATTRTTVGLGLGAGYNVLETGTEDLPGPPPPGAGSTGTDSVFEQLQGRVVWNPASRLSFSFSGGMQIQQFLGEDSVETAVNPIFSLSSGWAPTDGTTISLGARQAIGNSIISDQYTETTSFSLDFSQRLLKQLRFGVSPTYYRTEYRSSADPTGEASRSDESWGFRVSLATTLLRKINVSVFYAYLDNESDDEFYSFDSRQLGFQVGYRF